MNKLLTLLPLTLICTHMLAQGLPPLDWDELSKTSPWTITEIEKDVPVVTPANNGQPPSDAIILFGGTDLNNWEKTPFGEGVRMDRTAAFIERYKSSETSVPANWPVQNGVFISGGEAGAIATKQTFGDMQLHIEWFVPKLEGKSGQEYGNSGIFLMGLYELQVLNSHGNHTYANGQAGAFYKQHAPLVNASKEPGNWQAYDILFTAPRFSEKGNMITPARATVLHNGVLIQHNAVLQGPTVFIGEPYYVEHPAKLPIVLQDHDNPVRYRNIWVREL